MTDILTTLKRICPVSFEVALGELLKKDDETKPPPTPKPTPCVQSGEWFTEKYTVPNEKTTSSFILHQDSTPKEKVSPPHQTYYVMFEDQVKKALGSFFGEHFVKYHHKVEGSSCIPDFTVWGLMVVDAKSGVVTKVDIDKTVRDRDASKVKNGVMVLNKTSRISNPMRGHAKKCGIHVLFLDTIKQGLDDILELYDKNATVVIQPYPDTHITKYDHRVMETVNLPAYYKHVAQNPPHQLSGSPKKILLCKYIEVIMGAYQKAHLSNSNVLVKDVMKSTHDALMNACNSKEKLCSDTLLKEFVSHILSHMATYEEFH